MDDKPYLQVVESAKFIASVATEVQVVDSGVRSCAKKLLEATKKGDFKLSNWKDRPLNPKVANDFAIDWVFLVDTLNFSFWNDDDSNPFTVEYKGNLYTGYWALCACVDRAIDNNVPILSAEFLSKITLDQVHQIFKSTTTAHVPLAEERVRVLNEAGSVLLRDFGGSFKNVVIKSDRKASTLLKLITTNFTSYNDRSEFKGRSVSFLKRAQILIADLWACFEGKGIMNFEDIDDLTMFADYRVPQVLLYMDVLKYSDRLLETLKSGKVFQKADPLEQEIRGCSIWSVELIKKEMKKLMEEDKSGSPIGSPLNSIVIDFYLWDYAKKNSNDMKSLPIHRVRSVFY